MNDPSDITDHLVLWLQNDANHLYLQARVVHELSPPAGTPMDRHCILLQLAAANHARRAREYQGIEQIGGN